MFHTQIVWPYKKNFMQLIIEDNVLHITANRDYFWFIYPIIKLELKGSYESIFV